VQLHASPLQGMARGLAFQIYENLGSVSRQSVTRELRAVAQADRTPLRRLGVRFGAFSIFLPLLVKPAAAKLKALLWAVHQGMTEIPPPPPAGLTSLPTDPSVPAGFYEAAGFRLCGPRAVRIDMLERLGEIIRGKGQGGQMPEGFAVSNDMMSVLGCGEDDIAQVLRSLGFRDTKAKNEAGEETTLWSQRLKRHERPQKPQRKRHEHQPKRAAAVAVPYGAPAGPAEAQPQEARQERQERHRHKDKDRKPRRDDERPQRHGKPQPKPYKEREPDPDSPFAVLAALKLRK
jgi:ATP-dependent RNA helicase SUPV3L1/SUV3